MASMARREDLEELRQKCKTFRSGRKTVESFEEIVAWASDPPRRFGLCEFKMYFAELDPDTVTTVVPHWAGKGRELLWSRQDRKHNDNLKRLQSWQPPPKPIKDDFGLQRYWPCCMESLRPFPKDAAELLNRGNAVYRFVAGQDCFDAERSVEKDKYQHPFDTFVIFSCVVQFKVTDPILQELNRRERDEDDETLKGLLESFRSELIKLRGQALLS